VQVNVGASLANKIPNCFVRYNSYLSGNYKDSFFLTPTCPDEVINIVNAITSKRSSGYDGISVDTMKLAIPYVVLPITNKI